MMQASAPGSWVALIWMLHATFSIVAALGVLFFIVWAIKHLSAQKMKTLWIWLLVVGIVGSIITCPLLLGLQTPFGWGSPQQFMHSRFSRSGVPMKNMMDRMEKNGMKNMMGSGSIVDDEDEDY